MVELLQPTFEEVAQFMKMQGITAFTPERFFYYYARSGWVDSKGIPIEDWRKTVLSWIPLEKERAKAFSRENKAQSQKMTHPSVDHIGEQLEREARQAKDAEQHVSWEEYKRMKAEGRI